MNSLFGESFSSFAHIICLIYIKCLIFYERNRRTTVKMQPQKDPLLKSITVKERQNKTKQKLPQRVFRKLVFV